MRHHVFLFLTILLCLPLVPPISAQTPDHIVITGDQDLVDQAQARGWQGDGSAGDPIVISDYEFAVNPSNYRPFQIRDTTLSIRLENIVLTGPEEFEEVVGIELENVANIVIKNVEIINIVTLPFSIHTSENVTVTDTKISFNKELPGFGEGGLMIYESVNIRVEDTEISGQDGIRVVGSTGVELVNNRISAIIEGVNFQGSNHSKLIGNRIYNSGITIYDETETFFYDTFIESNNTVNDLPFVYVYNKAVPDLDLVGQLVLVNVSHAVIADVQISNTYWPMTILQSHHLRLENIELISNSKWFSAELGIRYSNHITIDNIEVDNTKQSEGHGNGLIVYFSRDIMIEHSRFEGGSTGMYLYEHYNSTITNNYFKDMQIGIRIDKVLEEVIADDQTVEITQNTFENVTAPFTSSYFGLHNYNIHDNYYIIGDRTITFDDFSTVDIGTDDAPGMSLFWVLPPLIVMTILRARKSQET